jgi:hypothetical protein
MQRVVLECYVSTPNGCTENESTRDREYGDSLHLMTDVQSVPIFSLALILPICVDKEKQYERQNPGLS